MVQIQRFLRLQQHLSILPLTASAEEALVGGQAVIEGVMMRAPHSYCVSVRRPDGSLATEQAPIARMSEKYPWFKLPILRGVGTLGQAMMLGVKALQFSATAALEEADGKKEKPVSPMAMALHVAFSVGFFIILYKLVPLWATTELSDILPFLEGQIAFNVTDGIIRLLIFLGFLGAISRFRDIQRVFEYHGAEHKVVYNFESRQPLSVENAQRFSTLHPRCGTSFLLIVMMVSIAVYAVVPLESFWAKLLLRVVALPLIAGLSYEVIRFTAKRRQSLLATLVAPGLWLQRITTKQPDDSQVTVAIDALNGAMELERAQGGELILA